MKRNLILFLAMFLFVAEALAVPAKRGVTKNLTLADGSRVVATLQGDEYANYYLASDGRAFQMKDGAYTAVDRSALETQRKQLMQVRNKQRAARRVGTAPEGGYQGQKKGLVILVEFTDVKFTYGQSVFKDYFNKVGFNSYGMHGSVHDYFYEQSYGKLDLEFDIVGPVTMTSAASYYSTDNKRVAGMVNTLCKNVDDQVDFSKYDWDGDGTVDQVYVIYAGWGAAQGADNTIWPHEWTVRASGSQYNSKEGVLIDTYGISCELRGRSGSEIDGIGTSCHEFSHCLGLPDFYDTRDDGTNFGMNVWSLMDYGCYNGDNNGQCPSGYTAYERWFAGWLEPIELNSSCQITDMPAIEEEPVAYIMYNDKNKNEYYLLANHQIKGFDESQYGHGLLVLHVDYDATSWSQNTVNNTVGHERMTIIPADNSLAVSNSNLAGDPFPGTRNNTQLTDESRPSASLYNANLDGRKFMGKPLTDITEVDGLVTFNVMGGVYVEPPVVAEASNITATSFRANWQDYPGAQGYTVCLTQTIASDNPWDFLMIEENFEDFETSYAGNTDLSSQLDNFTQDIGWDGMNIYTSPNLARVGKASKPGRLVTPVLEQPSQNALSIAFTPLSGSARSEGELELRIMLASDTTQYARGTVSEIPIVGSENAGMTWLMGLEEWAYGDFRIGIVAKGSGVYMQYIGVFDGYYSWDDFPSNSAPALKSKSRVHRLSRNDLTWNTPDGKAPKSVTSRPRKAKKETTTYYNAINNYYNFTDLEPAIYSYKVRVATSEGYSNWSDEKTVDMTTGINEIKREELRMQNDGAIYDLAGRQIVRSSSNRQLQRGIYIQGGKKVLVK